MCRLAVHCIKWCGSLKVSQNTPRTLWQVLHRIKIIFITFHKCLVSILRNIHEFCVRRKGSCACASPSLPICGAPLYSFAGPLFTPSRTLFARSGPLFTQGVSFCQGKLFFAQAGPLFVCLSYLSEQEYWLQSWHTGSCQMCTELSGSPPRERWEEFLEQRIACSSWLRLLAVNQPPSWRQTLLGQVTGFLPRLFYRKNMFLFRPRYKVGWLNVKMGFISRDDWCYLK